MAKGRGDEGASRHRTLAQMVVPAGEEKSMTASTPARPPRAHIRRRTHRRAAGTWHLLSKAPQQRGEAAPPGTGPPRSTPLTRHQLRRDLDVRLCARTGRPSVRARIDRQHQGNRWRMCYVRRGGRR